MKAFIEGEKIYLRPFCKEDIPIWYNWFNSQDVTEHMYKGVFPNTEINQEEHLNNISKSNKDIQLAIVLKENDTLVGTVGIHKIDWVHGRGEISLIVGEKEYWNKGIATEAISLIVKHAFIKMNLHKLIVGMSSLNISSKKFCEKVGFVVEGTLRKNFFYKNSYVDEYIMGLLREDWEKLQNKRGNEEK